MAASPSVNINLLQRNDLEHSATARITTWAVTYGRYIMIGTEIIVLLAFISRFSLDRKLTDLKEEISQKQAILQANTGFEQDVRNVQDQLSKIKSITTDQTKSTDLIAFLSQILPPDVYLGSIDISTNKLVVSATAGTSDGFSQFLTALSLNKTITGVEIGDIQKQPGQGIQFKLSAQIGAPPAPKK